MKDSVKELIDEIDYELEAPQPKMTGCKIENGVLTFDKKIQAITKESFCDFKNIEKVIIPEGVVLIGEKAFANCTSLKEVIFPDSLQVISREAFSGCKSLKHVDIPNFVEIGHNAFYESGLEEIALKDDITFSGSNIFGNCENLKKVVLPKNLEYLPSDHFMGTKIEEIILPEKLESLNYNVLSSLSTIKQITLPKNLKFIEYATFSKCVNLEKILVDEDNIHFKEKDGVLFDIRLEQLICFPKNSKITSYTVPESVKKIGNRSFLGCKNLKEIILPKNLEIIGEKAFKNTAFTSIDFPKTLKKIEKRAFLNASLEEVNVPFCGLDEFAFKYNKKLKKVIFNDNIKDIPAACFCGCNNLEEIKLPEKLEFIGETAFEGCSSLKDISFPSNLLCISDYAFMGCGFEKVAIPANVTFIGEGVFQDNEFLEKAIINASHVNIHDFVFGNCKLLKTAIINSKYANIYINIFEDCKNLTDIFISSKVLEKNPDFKNIYGHKTKEILDYIVDNSSSMKEINKKYKEILR